MFSLNLIFQEFTLTNPDFPARNRTLLVKSSRFTTQCNDVLLAKFSLILQLSIGNFGASELLAIILECEQLI